MNILIACHCKATHREIKIEPKKIKESDINIHFIDPKCSDSEVQFTQWENLPVSHYDIIWTIKCPIYGLLHLKDSLTPPYITPLTNFFVETWIDILKWGSVTLKPKGIIVVPMVDDEHDIMKNQVSHLIEELNLKNQLNVEIYTEKSLPIIINPPDEHKHKFVIIKKIPVKKKSTRKKIQISPVKIPVKRILRSSVKKIQLSPVKKAKK